MESFLPKVRNKTGTSTLTTVIQHSSGRFELSNQKTQRNKSMQIGQEEVKLSLFGVDMILLMENPKGSTKKLLEVIHELSKVAGEKSNAQK